MPSIAYRPAKPADRRFVEESFLDSFRAAHAAGLVAMDNWREVMGPEIARILARPGARTVVACSPGAEGTKADIYGWLTVEDGHDRPLIVYAYTKHAYRRLGIMRGLLAHAGIDPAQPIYFAAKTGAAAKLTRRLFADATWKPLLVRFPPPQSDRGSNVASHRSPQNNQER